MASQEIWVHGTSGQIQVVDKEWGRCTPMGTGMRLDGNTGQLGVEFAYGDREPWFQFHIPTAKGVEGLLKLTSVMLRFSSDCNPAGPGDYKQIGTGFEQWATDAGGAIIKQLHVYDGDIRLNPGQWDDLNWQSPDIQHTSQESVTFDPPVQINWGIGVSVRVWFKNQFFVRKGLWVWSGLEGEGPPGRQLPIDPGWNGNPWRNDAVATPTKTAWLISVGCEVISS